MSRSRRRAWILSVALVLALCAALTPAARAGRIEAKSARIVQVTVYPDRAEVLRQAQVQVPLGSSEVAFLDVPFGVEPDSLRVSARGVPAVLGAVELKQEAEAPAKSDEYIAADKEVKRLEGELGALDAQDAVSNDLLDYLRSLKNIPVSRAPAEKPGEAPKVDAGAIQAIYGILKSDLDDLQRQALARKIKRAELQQDLQVARAKRDAAKPQGSIRSRTAVVEIEARQAGALTFDFSYVAPGAFWRPAYRATLDAAKGEVDLVAEGVVVQRSGEDWDNVALTLSTAAPARGVSPPELTAWLLRPYEPQPMAKAKLMERSEVVGGYGAVVGGVAASAAAPPPPPEEAAEMETAEIVHTAYNVSFDVPGKTTVPADGREHRVTLDRQTLKSDVSYRTAPAAQEAAFLIAKTHAPAAYPLLGGPMRVFAGPTYLGSLALPETGPGAELTVPFGQDNRVVVKHVVLPQGQGREGFISKDKVTTFGFKTTIENLRDVKVDLVLEDRIPVSEDERIKVEVGDATTKGYKNVPDRPGIVEWTLTLNPKEKKEVILEYSVRRPKDLNIPGL